MKIGIFSDLHLRKGGKRVGNWYRRTLDGLDVLDQVCKVFLDEKVDMFVFLGDFFHQRYQIDVQVLSGAVERLMTLSKIPGNFIPGNHDLYYSSSVAMNSLVAFSLKWRVHMDVIQDGEFVFLPFMSTVTDEIYRRIKKFKGKYLFMHQILKGFPIQSDYFVREGEEVFDYTKCETYEWVISGHTHIPHNKGKVISVGSVMEQSFQDSDSKIRRGCWILEDDTIRKIELEYPRFFTVADPNLIKSDKDYYRLMIKESEYSKTVAVPENVQLFRIPEEKRIDRLQIGEKWNIGDVISKYVKLKEKSNRYTEVGLEILKGV